MLSRKLAPEIRAILEAMAAQGGPPIESMPIEDARRASQGLVQLAGEPEPVASVEDKRIPVRARGVEVRVYTPKGTGPFPGVVYLHGGGWVLCDLNSHDTICRAISKRAEAVVIAVDYRLAPESKFPAALDDCLDAALWVASHASDLHIDPTKLAIAGDSAGANMATVIATKARDSGRPAFALQVLVYPVVNLTAFETPSHQEFAEDHFLTRSFMEWCLSLYIPQAEDRKTPDASPYFTADLHNLPPALVITAECDPLRDEGEAYAKRLEASGVPVTLTRYEGVIHPFLNLLGATPSAQKAVDQIAAAVRGMAPVKPAKAAQA